MYKKINKFFSIVMAVAVMAAFHSCKDDNDATNSLELSLSENDITAGFKAGTYEVEITTNGEWEATPYNSWCTVSPQSGTGNATITVSLEENITEKSRNTSIEVVARTSDKQKKEEIINIQQLNTNPTFEVNFTEKSLDFEEQFIELTVTSNMPTWGIVLPPWCKSVDGYPLTYVRQDPSIKETTVRIKVKKNGTKNSRQGTIGVTAVGAPTPILKVTVTQGPTDFVYVPANGGPASKTFSGSWTAVSGESWVTVPASGSDNITLNAEANQDKLPRQAVITITSGEVVKKIVVAQEPKLDINLSQTWTDASGTRHTSIPADKKFWNTGEVLEYNRATIGNGATVILFNDAFNKMELAVGGVYETSTRESAELFLSLPVLRDYKEYFNIYILMRVWDKSGLYNQYPNGTYVSPMYRPWDFTGHINSTKQIENVPHNEITSYYYANGMAGGFMSSIDGIAMAAYSFGAEPEYPYWTMHEFMGHGFTFLGDMYQAPGDISEWAIYPNTHAYQPVTPVNNDPIGNDWAPNCFLAEWSQDAWDAFIALPGNDQYASNLEKYRMDLPAAYRTKHPAYTGGNYIWRMNNGDDFMSQHTMSSSGWSRYLIYRRIMRLAGLPYSVVDFFKKDQQYANVDNWWTLLDLHGWEHSYKYDPHADAGSPFSPWDE
jgi:hypothetical protein